MGKKKAKTSRNKPGLTPDQVEYANWRCLDRRTRRALSMPLSQREFAQAKGVSDRTLRNWAAKPMFKEYERQRAHEIRTSQDHGVMAVTEKPKEDARTRPQDPEHHDSLVHDEEVAAGLELGLTPEEAEYQALKSHLVEQAREGSTQALQTYMNLFGKPYIEAERERLRLSFPELDDEQLVDRTLTLIGRGRVEAWLAHG